ncbi:TetR/AcrR family transcriptional regulator [Mycolicibacterium sp. CBM1]
MYRHQIITAAELEFARTGFDKTKVTDIARTADVSVDTVYKNFAGKSDIWDALNQQRMEGVIAAGEHAAQAVTSPLERLLCSARAQVMYFADHPHFLDLHIREGWSWATAGLELGRGAQRDVWRTGLSIVVALAEDAIAAGEIRALRPDIVAGLAVSALQVWLTDWVNTGRDRPAQVVADELVEHVQRILTAPDAHAAAASSAGS